MGRPRHPAEAADCRHSLRFEQGSVTGSKADAANTQMGFAADANGFGRAPMLPSRPAVLNQMPPKKKSRRGCKVDTVSFEDNRLKEVPSVFRKRADQRNDKVLNFG